MICTKLTLTSSIGASLVDALDNFIAERRIEPQIAIKMLEHFDRVVAEVLNDKVKARLSFKVRSTIGGTCSSKFGKEN